MRLIAILTCVAGIAAAQSTGTIQNVLFSSNNNLLPAGQGIAMSADGTAIAVTGSLPTIADVVIVNLNELGGVASTTNVLFPSSNDVHSTNTGLVASRTGRFFCCYGSNATVGDLVFITRNGSGSWVATNVVFPSSNNAPALGIAPVISEDEDFIVCRGLAAVADLVIIPVSESAGLLSPGTPFNEVVPGGNTVPLVAINPVIAPNSLSFAIPGSNGNIGDLIIANVGRPVTAANTLLGNLTFPNANNLVNLTTPPAVSPKSNYYAAHGVGTIGDLVVVAMDATGVPIAVNNVLWLGGNNTASTGVPPSVSGDGRLIAVNGTDSSIGDVVLVPIDATGVPGSPASGAFPGANNVANTAIPPVISADSLLVVQRGQPTIGDLVSIALTFTSATTFTGTMTNILYASNNNVPDSNAHIALAPDRSYAATLGTGTIGDLVITPFDAAGVPAAPWNITYANNNNVANLGTTPRISREGLLVVTSGSPTIGDVVLTGVRVNPATGLIEPLFASNLLYPNANDNAPGREPVFTPTTQSIVSAGAATIGDLVVVPLLDPFPRILARADAGVSVTIRLASPADAGKFAIGLAAFGRHPGILLPPPDNRTFPLNFDALLQLTLDPLNGFVVGLHGALDTDGLLNGTVDIPPIPGLEGLWIYLAFAVVDPAGPIGIGTLSRPATFLLE